ncbi:hypothetical protein ACOSP7_004170 [Xanthoceras sorbifolium]
MSLSRCCDSCTLSFWPNVGTGGETSGHCFANSIGLINGEIEPVIVDEVKNKESGADLKVKQFIFYSNEGRNSDMAGAVLTSQQVVLDNLISRNEVKVGAAAPPDSGSVVVQINETKVLSFTEKRVVFMSPKQVIVEECFVENVQ